MNFIKNGDFSHFFASPFITKAEFDSLKNNFQSQIDQYNSSIDSKIDGAIAAYLAGIKLTKKVTYDIVDKSNSIQTINFMNGAYSNDYVIPNIKYNLSIMFGSIVVNNAMWAGDSGYLLASQKRNDLVASAGGTLSFSTKNNTMDDGRICKNIVEVKDGNETNIKKLSWKGISEKYVEDWLITSSKWGWMSVWLDRWDVSSNNQQVFIKYPLAMKVYTTYNENLNNEDILNEINIKAQYDGPSWKDTGGNFTTKTDTTNPKNNWSSTFFNGSVTTEKVDNKDFTHKKIYAYDGGKYVEINCVEAVHYLLTSTNQTITDTNVFEKLGSNDNNKLVTNQLYYTAVRAANTAASSSFGVYKRIQFGYEHKNKQIPTLGLLGNYKFSEIYRVKEPETVNYGVTLKVEDIKMNQGAPIVGGKADQNVEWTAKFDEVDCYNLVSGVKTMCKNDNEVDIYLSKSPFNDKLVPTGGTDDIIKNGTSDHWTTNDRSVKIKFTLDKECLVYMKAIPHWNTGSTSYLDDFWDIYCNIDGANGQWTLESES